MDKTFGYIVFGGMLIGAVFGWTWGPGSHSLMGAGAGALAGAFVGWFVAAAALEQKKNQR